MPARANTRERILQTALDLFGTRGFNAVSLDEVAESVGVRKQTVLYWFPSKDDLLTAVVEMTSDELAVAVDAAVRNTGMAGGFGPVEAVVRAVFRPAIRRPALLGLVRDLGRLDPAIAARLTDRLDPALQRAIAYLEREAAAGRLRKGDPRLLIALTSATVVGVATEPEVLRAVGWRPTAADLRRLRRELIAYLRAALVPSSADGRAR
jgi:AcrR family transcriptional regulator